jgi:pimeloyl-ACP methyl ester carboxylesterase
MIIMEDLRPVRRYGRIRAVAALLAAVALLAPLLPDVPASAKPAHGGGARPRPTIVLVHGDWADASSWNAVTERLQDPLRGPIGDAAYLASFLQTIPGPIVLVAHSYGGFVVTNAATGNPNVEALVYVDAFIPDEGQRAADLVAGSCVDPETALHAVPVPGGVVDLYLRREPYRTYPGFAECFANGVGRNQTALLFATQRPAALNQYDEPSGPPAWETIPSWSLIGTADRVITPAQQRAMSTNAGARITTVDTGHLSLITRPGTVTSMIETAARATT